MEKTLTISIAAYNVSLFLEKNIESIIASNRLSQIDVIIVNDGSKDDTAEIAKKYIQQFPESISVIDKKNGGYGSTINHSLSKARGKYYRLLDGDDWVDSDALTSFIDSIMKFDCDLVLNPYKTVIEGLKKENIVHILAEVVHKRIYDLTEISSRIDLLPMHGMTFRTELLKENEIFITENCFYTDAEFTIFPLPFVSTVAYLNDVVYCYRIGLSEQSMSFNGFKKHYKEHQMVIEHLIEYKNRLEVELNPLVMKLILDRIAGMIKKQYEIYLRMGSSYYSSLENFDKKLKNEEPELYKLIGVAKPISFLRKTNYSSFPIISLYKRVVKN